jgi:hypothetical protein
MYSIDGLDDALREYPVWLIVAASEVSRNTVKKFLSKDSHNKLNPKQMEQLYQGLRFLRSEDGKMLATMMVWDNKQLDESTDWDITKITGIKCGDYRLSKEELKHLVIALRELNKVRT